MTMSMNHLRRLALATLLTTLLSACATGPRTAESDAGVRNVTVVTLLEEKAPISRVGLTVFNNEVVEVDQGGELNRLSRRLVEQHLRDKRPDWVIKDAGVDSTMLAKKNREGGVSWTSFTGNISDDLRRVAKATGADLVFVVLDTTMENSPGRGVGLTLRTVSLSSVSNALVHAHVLLTLVDKDGKELTNRSGGNSLVPAAELGIKYDVRASLKDPLVQRRVSDALKKQLSASLDLAASSMGY